MKVNQATKIPYHFPPHFWRHCISTALAVGISCGIDVVLGEYFKLESRIEVRWQDGSRTTITRKDSQPVSVLDGSKALMGFGDDGKLYWRPVNLETNK